MINGTFRGLRHRSLFLFSFTEREKGMRFIRENGQEKKKMEDSLLLLDPKKKERFIPFKMQSVTYVCCT